MKPSVWKSFFIFFLENFQRPQTGSNLNIDVGLNFPFPFFWNFLFSHDGSLVSSIQLFLLLFSSFSIFDGIYILWYFPKKGWIKVKFLMPHNFLAFLYCLIVSSIVIDKAGAILILLPLNVNLKEIITTSFKIFFLLSVLEF